MAFKDIFNDTRKKLNNYFGVNQPGLGTFGKQIKPALNVAAKANPVTSTIARIPNVTRRAVNMGTSGLRDVARTVPAIGGTVAKPFRPASVTPQGRIQKAILGSEPIYNMAGAIQKNAPLVQRKTGFTPTLSKSIAGLGFVAAVNPVTGGGKKEAGKQIAKLPLSGLKKTAQNIAGNIPQLNSTKTVKSPSETFSLFNEVKRKLIDSSSPIQDTLTKAENAGKFKVLPKNDIRLQIDKVLRSDSLASQYIKDNKLDEVIRGVDNLDEFNQYLISKQARDVATKGIKTGRDLAKDDQLVSELAQKYEPFAQELYKYNRNLLDYLTDSGMISKGLNVALKKEYPNYVPLNRVFDEVEQKAMGIAGRGKGIASQGSQGVVKRLKGSERDIENPIESIISKTSQAFQQAERNKAAQMLSSYKDLPGNPFGLEEIVGAKSPGDSTISVFKNGVKKIYKADPIIAEAAKNLNQQQLTLLGQIIALPVRVLKLGATGLNLPFVASNLVKDQVFATINSNRALKTSIANPVNFVQSFWSALTGNTKLYDDWVRSGASFTSFDIARDQVKPTVAKIRAGKNLGTKIAYTATNPKEWLRGLENMIGKSEELTRIQQFNGMRNQLIKEGRNVEEATLLAAQAARENSGNFARRGEWGNWLNVLIPYLNAGLQGTRSVVRNAKNRPLQTGAKMATLLFMPAAYATAWNLSDPKRKEAYDDIQEYEKEGNFVIIPPNPTKDENGRWNAIKIPITPGLSNLTSIVRRSVEGAYGIDSQTFGKVASDLFSAGTSFDLDPRKLGSQLVPQGLKPLIENQTNTNLFTGNKIVPEYMKDYPAELQVRENTSGTARKIGGLLNTSPLKVENTVRTALGGVGSQLLNLSDRTLAKAGVIPEEQIGGKGAIESVSNRFSSAAGGQKLNDLYDNKSKKNSEGIIENNGKFFVKTGNKVSSFDNREDAELSVAKNKFKETGKNIEVRGDKVFRLSKDGDVKVQDKDEYDYSLNTNKRQKAKKDNDYKTWLDLSNKQLQILEKQSQDTSLDELELSDLAEKYNTILGEMEKYKGYGGFKKGKKLPTFKVSAPSKTKIPVQKASKPKFKAVSTKIPLIKTPKAKLISKSTLANLR